MDTRIVWYNLYSIFLYRTFLKLYNDGGDECRSIVLHKEHDIFRANYPELPNMIETIILHAGFQWVKDNA